MLQVWGISGEEVASVPVAEMHDVRTLKQSLQKVCGLPRFRQRLLHDGRDLEDVARLEMVQDVQLVLLDFCPVSHHEARHLFKAADGGMVLEVEKALQRPQDPNQTTSPTHPTPLNRAARNGHMEVVHLLLEATADLESYSDFFGEHFLFSLLGLYKGPYFFMYIYIDIIYRGFIGQPRISLSFGLHGSWQRGWLWPRGDRAPAPGGRRQGQQRGHHGPLSGSFHRT